MESILRIFKNIYHNIITNLWDLLGLLQIKFGIEPTFIKTSRMALEQWKTQIAVTNFSGKKKILIVAFRNYTWVEWAIFAAHYMYRMGYHPIVLFSNQEIVKLYPNKRFIEKMGFNFWNGVEKLNYIKIINIDEYTTIDDSSEETYCEFAHDFSATAAAYNLRVEEFEEHVLVDEYNEEKEKCEAVLRKYGTALEKVLTSLKFERLICPSGLIGISSAVLEVTKRLNIESVFVEGWAMRPGHMIWALNQPALEYDIQGWAKVIGNWDDHKERESMNFQKFQEKENLDLENLQWLKDFHSVQRIEKNMNFSTALNNFMNSKGPLFLLGTNVVGDSSTLRRSTIFKNQKEWLKEIVVFFKQHSEYRVIIRAHPDEVWQRAKVKIGDYAYNLAKDIPNIYVIKGEDNTNTYSLVKYAIVGLAWLSTLGIDMVLRGKPVLVAASPKYDNLGIVTHPKTKNEYFYKLIEYANDPPKPTEEAIQMAKFYQRIVFKDMSLEATSKNYNSIEYRLGRNRMHAEQEKFYKILAGELNEKGLLIE